MTSEVKILFIIHIASRNGATVSLLNFSKILKNNGYDLSFIAKNNGELENEFRSLGDYYIWDIPWKYEPNVIKRIYNRLFNSAPLRKKRILKSVQKSKTGLIINNTVTNGDILYSLSNLNTYTITWVHELEYVINIFDIRENNLVKNTFQYSNKYFAASNSVKENLIRNHEINKNDIEVVFEIVDDVTPNEKEPKCVNLTNSGSSFIVGGCGALGWRKGSDLFLQVANDIINKKKVPDIRFIWIGGLPSTAYYYEFLNEIKLFGLENYVSLIEHNLSVLDYYKKMDLFCLTSREDPFPLVMIEAGINNLPILAFEKSGGVTELIEKDYLVPYSDINAMAEKILEFYYNKELLCDCAIKNKNNCIKFMISNMEKTVLELINNISI